MGIGIIHRLIRPIEFWWKSLVLSVVPEKDPFVIVTGADKTHSRSLINLLGSLKRWEPDIRTVVYDLGLEPGQREELASRFPAAEVRRFEYSKYPAYFDIRVMAGHFAWKPVIFSDAFDEFRCSVCWFDAGNVVTEPLTRLRKVVQWKGFYATRMKGAIGAWTHPGTLSFLNAGDSIPKKKILAGGCVAANHRSRAAREFVRAWRECALVRECIAPEGSDRYNHRQDMSVLSILAYQMHLPMCFSSFQWGFKFQQDAD